MAGKVASKLYYHCCGIGLAVGSIIQPGNWGRMLRLYETPAGQGLPTHVFREALLELARQIHASDKPTRLESVFVLLTHDEAVRFRDKHRRTDLIYEVVPTVENPPMHLGDYDFAVAPYPPRYFDKMFEFARDYWLVAPTANIECLLGCPVRVVGT